MSTEVTTTPFSKVYNSFLSKITDDMYMEFTKEETYEMLEGLLLSAIPKFEFPRVDLYNFTNNQFNAVLTYEEINIIATYMIVEWIGRQLATVELIRLKYSGSDFKFTSQANHMSKLLALKRDYEREGFHLQRLYKRRKADKQGIMRSTFGEIMNNSFSDSKLQELQQDVKDLQRLVGHQSDSNPFNDKEIIISAGNSFN